MVFSLLPLVMVTFFSLAKYEEAMQQDVKSRLKESFLELDRTINNSGAQLEAHVRVLAKNKSIHYYITNKFKKKIFTELAPNLNQKIVSRALVYNREGLLLLSLINKENQFIRERGAEAKEYYLSKNYLESASSPIKASPKLFVVFDKKGRLLLKVFTAITTSMGRLIGYVQLNQEITKKTLNIWRAKTGADIVISPQARVVDLVLDAPAVFTSLKNTKLNVSSLNKNISKAPYFSDSNNNLIFGNAMQIGESVMLGFVALSQKSIIKAIGQVRVAFAWAVGGLMIMLIVFYIATTKVLLAPMDRLIVGIQKMKTGSKGVLVETAPANELGIVIDSFNEMSQALDSTQSQLVHQAKMASLGQLVAGVAHELNNPIGFIYANMKYLNEHTESLFKIINTAQVEPEKLTEVLAKEDFLYIKKDLPKLIKSCEAGAERTKDIVIGLRNFSRLDEAQLKETDLCVDLTNTIDLLSGEFQKRIEIIKQLEDVPKINCYPSQLNQVFMNILANAAQSIEGAGKIYVSVSMADKKTILVSIKDTGPGMSKDVMSKIFDPFFTTKKQGEGTGLGLSISFGIIEEHKGSINVVSQPGKGTDFQIKLPINQ